MNPTKSALDTAEKTLEQAKQLGAQGAMVSLRLARSVECQVRDQKLEKLQESQSAGLTVQLFVDGRYAAHNTSDLRPAELTRFLSDAVAMTRLLDADPERSLADPALCLKAPKELPLADPAYDGLNTEARKRLARATEAAAKASERVISATASFSDEHVTSVAAGSNGVRAAQRGTVFSLGAEVTIADGDKRPEDWWYATTRNLKDLGAPEDLGKKAMQRALDRVGAKKLPSGPRVLVIENRAAGRLVSHLLAAAMGANLQQKRSFLDGMVGKQVASNLLTVQDDPELAGGLGSRSCDRDGMVAKPLTLIDKGVFKAYLLDWYYAQKLKQAPTTGNWSNLVFGGGSSDLNKLLAGIDNGVLVTSFVGGNSNSLTGDFSLGIQGRAIDKGTLGGPVAEMNLTGNHKTFWNQLTAMGGDAWTYSALRTPSLRFDGASLSGA